VPINLNQPLAKFIPEHGAWCIDGRRRCSECMALRRYEEEEEEFVIYYVTICFHFF
jgi:hypothetical protein